MKRQIRIETFETNSSSVHTLSICSEEEFAEWKAGRLLYNKYCYSNKDMFIQSDSCDLTEEEKEEAKEWYNEAMDENYSIAWDNLTSKAKERWYAKYASENELSRSDYCTFEEYMCDDYLETFSDHYTTKSGDKIVCFGKYGYDG